MDVTVILNQMAQLVLVMAAGYGLYKQGQIDDVFYSRLNKFVLHVTMPAMILGSVLTQSRSVQIHMPSMAASCLILTAVLPVLSFLTAKLLPVAKEDKGLYAFMMMYPNVGFMGFPIMKSIFGNDSVLATSVINLCFNISLFTIGPAAMGKQNSEKNVFSLKTFLSPGIIAVRLFHSLPFCGRECFKPDRLHDYASGHDAYWSDFGKDPLYGGVEGCANVLVFPADPTGDPHSGMAFAKTTDR